MNEQLAAGYDVLVWIDEDGDVVCRGYSSVGTQWLQGFYKQYKHGELLQILSSPNDFSRQIPDEVSVGLLTEKRDRVLPFAHPVLH